MAVYFSDASMWLNAAMFVVWLLFAVAALSLLRYWLKTTRGR